jgi:hypothetical protein
MQHPTKTALVTGATDDSATPTSDNAMSAHNIGIAAVAAAVRYLGTPDHAPRSVPPATPR